MLKIFGSDIYRVFMYFAFSFGVFCMIGVWLSHGGIFGESIVPKAIQLGALLIGLSSGMYILQRFCKTRFKR